MAFQKTNTYEPQGDFQNYHLPEEIPSVISSITPAPTGAQVSSGDLRSMNFVKGRQGWAFDSNGNLEANNGNFRGDITGASGTFSGTVTVSSLNIPDSTTASSFHTDSSGNSWWGANVASGYANANASILSTGQATFKNVLVGGATIQYTATDTGIGTFGDGSDGAGVADGSTALTGATLAANVYTLTRDVYYTNLTVSTGVTIKPSGYRIFGTGTLSLNGTAIIQRNGNAGSVGVSYDGTNAAHAGGAAGVGLSDGYLKGTDAGTAGGSGNTIGGNDSSSGTNKINSIGVAGAVGGDSASTAGTVTASNVKLIANWHLATLLDIGSSGSTVKYDGSANSTGGHGGGSNSSSFSGGGGGGAGSAAGILAIYFRNISVGASASITATGGVGGNGGDGSPAAGSAWAGAGGAGGSGGNVILVYNTLSNSGTVSANGGAGGTRGSSGSVVIPSNGPSGNNGFVRQFSLSQ